MLTDHLMKTNSAILHYTGLFANKDLILLLINKPKLLSFKGNLSSSFSGVTDVK